MQLHLPLHILLLLMDQMQHATSNPLGVKGCGEAGAIASPPTVMNAVINALGGQEITMPATAEKVWKACKTMKKSNAKAAQEDNMKSFTYHDK